MILSHDLNDAEKKHAQDLYVRFSGVNALAGIFSGATVQVLLAVQLGIGNAWVSGIGSLPYLSYLVLPFGVKLAARDGVGRSMCVCSVLSGLLCFCIALSPLLPGLKASLFFASVGLLYFAVSCRCAMTFPLQKNITDDHTVSRLIGRTMSVTYAVCLPGSLLITLLLAKGEAMPVLGLLFCGGGALYAAGGLLIGRIPEPSRLKELAGQPMLRQIRTAWQDGIVRKQLLAGAVLNLTLATVVPVSLVAVKNGFQLDNAKVMLLSTLQLAVSIAGAWIFRRFTEHFGPRKMMIVTYPLVWLLDAFYLAVPSGVPWWLLSIPFLLSGLLTVIFSAALNDYFTISVPNPLQVGGTLLVFLLTGGLVGACGLVLNTAVFKILDLFSLPGPVAPFRIYYLLMLILFVPGIFSVTALPVKYIEYRRKHNGTGGPRAA